MVRHVFIRSLAATALAVLLANFGQAGDNCAPTCCPVEQPCVQEVCKKVCVPTVETVKTPHAEYRMKCDDLCLPKCSLGGLFSRFGKKQCDECGECAECNSGCSECARCGKPREIRRLVKRFRVEEECKTKCVVEHRIEMVPVKAKCTVECAPAVCAPAPCAPAACAPAPCAPACERNPWKKKEFCCPDHSNPYAGTPLDPALVVPAKPAPKAPEPLPAPAKEAGKVSSQELPVGLPQ